MRVIQGKTGANHSFLDAYQLKLALAALMLLDHLYYDLFPQSLEWAHIAARVVAPAFCYLMTEGMIYTRDRAKYIRRLYLFGAVMWSGNILLYAVYGSWISNNILLSLAVGASLIHCADSIKRENGILKLAYLFLIVGLCLWAWVPDAVGYTLRFVRLEGGTMIPLMAVLFYYLRRSPVAMWASYFIVFGVPYLLELSRYGRLETQFWMVLVFIPIMCYNGKRGSGGAFAKYFFYIFYPLHIWLIFLIEHIFVR